MWDCVHTGFIFGPPVAMGRPRMTKQGRAYTPAKSREYMADAVGQIQKQYGDATQLANEPLRLQLVFVHKRPQRIKHTQRVPKTTKPDIDNLIKMVMDALTKSGIWLDDNIVTEVAASDWYANEYEQPHVMYSIYTQRRGM